MSRFVVQSSQKTDLKNRKYEKMPENSQILACFGVFEKLNLLRLNFAAAVKLYLHFLQIKMVGKLKSRAIACNQVFLCVKNADFSPNHKVLGGNVPVFKH